MRPVKSNKKYGILHKKIQDQSPYPDIEEYNVTSTELYSLPA
jgi:hypothetical protein